MAIRGLLWFVNSVNIVKNEFMVSIASLIRIQFKVKGKAVRSTLRLAGRYLAAIRSALDRSVI